MCIPDKHVLIIRIMINYLDFNNINIHDYFCILNVVGFSWTQVKKY